MNDALLTELGHVFASALVIWCFGAACGAALMHGVHSSRARRRRSTEWHLN